MRKIGMIGLIICLCIVALYAYPPQQTSAKALDTGELLNTAFVTTGAEVNGYFVHNWSVVNQEYVDMATLHAQANRVNDILRIQNTRVYQNSDEKQRIYQIFGTWSDQTSVSIIFNSMKTPDSSPQTSLVIRIDYEGKDASEISKAISKVKKAVEQVGGRPQISTCIKGFLNDRMDSMEKDRLIQKTFQAVQASEVEALRSDLLTSVSGYSPLSDEYIMTSGKRMNVQMALHYDIYQKRTLVLIGSPIVTIEY